MVGEITWPKTIYGEVHNNNTDLDCVDGSVLVLDVVLLVLGPHVADLSLQGEKIRWKESEKWREKID